VGDEVLARLAPLVGMALAGKCEGPLDRNPVDLRGAAGGVLTDYREEVAEELSLLIRELLRDLVDRRGPVRAVLGADTGVTGTLGVLLGPVKGDQFLVCLRSLRYLRPSSQRCR
jgi:hypothetical protein